MNRSLSKLVDFGQAQGASLSRSAVYKQVNEHPRKTRDTEIGQKMQFRKRSDNYPQKGEVWLATFSPTIGREQSGFRTSVIVSVDRFNAGYAELVFVCPTTTKDKKIPTQVKVVPPEGGFTQISFVKCEDLRSISKLRLIKRLGKVSPQTLQAIENRIRLLLGI